MHLRAKIEALEAELRQRGPGDAFGQPNGVQHSHTTPPGFRLVEAERLQDLEDERDSLQEQAVELREGLKKAHAECIKVMAERDAFRQSLEDAGVGVEVAEEKQDTMERFHAKALLPPLLPP